mgnify:CR=1 FL=1
MKIVDKPWGREEWLVLNDHYCLKRLYVNKGEKLSLQYHEIKHETMILESGDCMLQKDNYHRVMRIGDPITIEPKSIHRIQAIEDTIILEVSTPEVDDIVRLEDNYGRTKE